ncbi:hypothetical protein CWE13_03055 [Aliidiomarina shirensis]|uniref:Uncharacterized protein n=1 Tax=Aliidiomarina shirensis TaxID=1048642 RepID=A0A432WY01_9GAMM|nr:hypothetical protein [Aliidiomarina shirensis]RUO38639.1 hypothetical protein CWE13_03055 [Aliidiomarina shirensis]
MKYLMMIPMLGLGLIQVITWFGILPPTYLTISLSVACIVVFLVGLISVKRYAGRTGASFGEEILGNLNLKPFLCGLILLAYFFFNFFYSVSMGGNTKVENGKYFALRERPKEFYEISELEYNERQPHQVRALTGHTLLVGVVGFVMFCASRSSNKSSKKDAQNTRASS